MILLVIFILCFVLSLFMYILNLRYPIGDPQTPWQKIKNKLMKYADEFDSFFFVTLIISAAVLIICFIMLIGCHTFAEQIIAENKEIYKSITYQFESGMYLDDSSYDSYGQRKLMEDIENWNKDLAGYLVMEKNPWVGCFYYPKYEGVFEFIELDEFDKVDIQPDLDTDSSTPSISYPIPSTTFLLSDSDTE